MSTQELPTYSELQKELESLRQENSRLREALEKIACWKHEQGDFLPWPVDTARKALNPPKHS